MISKKNRAVSRLPISAILNCDDRKKFAAFVGLLVQINKRINPEEYTVTTRTRSKKTKKIDLEKTYKEGSQKCGPLPSSPRLRRTCLLLIIDTLSCIFNYFKICSIGKAYDRYSSITPQPRFIPNY